MSTITETLKAKIDELELDRRLDDFTVATERAVSRGLAQAGELAHDNRDKVASLLDRAGAAIDARTDGRYAGRVATVRAQVVAGVDKLAAKRPATGSAAPATPQDAPSAGGEHPEGS